MLNKFVLKILLKIQSLKKDVDYIAVHLHNSFWTNVYLINNKDVFDASELALQSLQAA